MGKTAAKKIDLDDLDDLVEDAVDSLKQDLVRSGAQAQEVMSEATDAAIAFAEAAQRFAAVARKQAKATANVAIEEIKEHPLMAGATAALAAAALTGWLVSNRRR